MEGFTERPALADLTALARTHGLLVVEDLGSGMLAAEDGLASPALRTEPAVRESIAAGVDALCFSGDKLLGGPQAGIIVGRRDPLAMIRRHPLMRALRVDKITYAALEATLLSWLSGRAEREIPVVRMIGQTLEQIALRAERVSTAVGEIPGLRLTLADGASTIGGGTAPGSMLPTRLILLESDHTSADQLQERLRRREPPIITRVQDDRVAIDLRTVGEGDEERELADAIRECAR
jgi:L-seryl-tRNA(Ser) seleniumtransferase